MKYSDKHKVTGRTPFLGAVALCSMLAVLFVGLVTSRRAARRRAVVGAAANEVETGGGGDAGLKAPSPQAMRLFGHDRQRHWLEHIGWPKRTGWDGAGTTRGPAVGVGTHSISKVTSVAGVAHYHTRSPSQVEGGAVLSPRRGLGAWAGNGGYSSYYGGMPLDRLEARSLHGGSGGGVGGDSGGGVGGLEQHSQSQAVGMALLSPRRSNPRRPRVLPPVPPRRQQSNRSNGRAGSPTAL